MIRLLVLVVFAGSMMACQNEDSCDTNATLNGECFNLVVQRDVQNFVGGLNGHSRENFLLIWQFAPEGPQERVRFTIRADDDPAGADTSSFYLFQTGIEYSDLAGGMIFNGDISSGGIDGAYTYRFTEIDKENNRVSGQINFQYNNDFGSDSFESTFENVKSST
ncbi:MAG: hypothetical protein AAFW89_06945 [Bacteroidota bacterium]